MFDWGSQKIVHDNVCEFTDVVLKCRIGPFPIGIAVLPFVKARQLIS